MSEHIVLPSTMTRSSFDYLIEKKYTFQGDMPRMCQALTAGDLHFTHVTFQRGEDNEKQQAKFVNSMASHGWRVVTYKSGKSVSLTRKNLPHETD